MSTSLVVQTLLDEEAGVDLPRDEDDIALCEDGEPQGGDLTDEEKIFLEKFPTLKRELKRAIKKYRTLADSVDEVHTKFTKTNVVTNSLSVVSGAMSILGLVLAPATAGGSLALSAVGCGLGRVAGVASIVTDFMEYFHDKKVQDQVDSQASTDDQTVRETVKKSLNFLMNCKSLYDSRTIIPDVKKITKAFETARENPQLASAAKRLLATGRISASKSRQVQKAFGGTTLAMSLSSRLLNSALSGLFFGMDLHTLLKDWGKLQEGTKTELAEELRARASELEKKLTELTERYESLQQKAPVLRRRRRRRRRSFDKKMSLKPARPDSSRKETKK